jgi:hypothetical protein
MNAHFHSLPVVRRAVAVICLISMVTASATPAFADWKLEPHTIDAWNKYIALTEKRIDQELDTPAAFLRSDIAFIKRERAPGEGNVQTQQLTTMDKGQEIEIKDGTIHHWMGAVYIPGVTVDKVLAWVQDYNQHSKFFKEVEQSKLMSHPNPETYDIFLRLTRSKMGVTAKFNTNHTVVYRRNGTGRASSRSVATKIAQIDKAGTSSEKEFAVGDDSGYLWRLNSYWRFAERDGGVVVECETVGLSRPLGSWVSILNWFTFGKVRQIAESVARESLEDTLAAMRKGVNGVEKK